MIPRIVSDPLGGNPLALRAATGDAPAAWYAQRPRTPDEWKRHIVAAGAAAPTAWAEAIAPALETPGRAAMRLQRVIDGNGVVVTTGQQPGLFGGPIYTWSKALGALALADALEEASGRPVAPVFWAATDDSDFAESSWTMFALPGGAEELRIDGAPPTGVSMAHAELGDAEPLLLRLERSAGSAAWREPLSAVRSAYRRGQTVGGAYLELLRAILGPLGITVLDASEPSVRRAASPHLRAALREARPLADALSDRAAALNAAGYRPQVADVSGLSLVFRVVGGERRRIRAADGPAAAADAAADELSPNVLLRPVVERALLPTVAYVAGPAELAYFAQTGAVADTLGVDRPVAIPRWSCTIIEPHVERILDRFGFAVDDLRDPHAAETGLARRSLPPAVADALSGLRAAIDASSATLAADGSSLVPGAAITGAARTLEHRVARLERRFTAAMKRAMNDEVHQIATARGSLFPGGRRQERALNFIPLLARYGQELVERMRGAARAHADRMIGEGTAIGSASRDVGHAAPASSS